MSSLEDRRRSRPEPPGPAWSIGVFLSGFFICCGIAVVVVGLMVDALVREPRPCAKIGNVIAIAGDCR